MGYNTRYELTSNEWPLELSRYIIENHDDFYGIEIDGSTYDDCKWYEHEKNMKILSLNFPKIHFTLYGEGEESGDIWKKHFLNGKMQICKAIITFDDFDINKLK